MYGQCFPSPVSLCLAPSPCTRLSRAPSTLWASPTSITASTFLRRFPIGWPTRPRRAGRDSDGPPRFLMLPFQTCRALRPRRSLRQSSPITTAYCCLPEFRPCRPADKELTRLNRFTSRYSPPVALPTLSSCRYLHEPKARFPVEWLSPFRCGIFTRWKHQALPGAPKIFSVTTSTLPSRFRRNVPGESA